MENISELIYSLAFEDKIKLNIKLNFENED